MMKKVDPFRQLAQEWEQTLQDLEAMFRVCVTVHEVSDRVRAPDGALLFPARGIHRHPLCKRDAPGQLLAGACVRHCHFTVRQKLEKSPRAFVSRCPHGLREVVVPICSAAGQELILFAGPFASGRSNPALGAGAAPYSADVCQRLIRLLQLVGEGIVAQATRWGAGSLPESRKEIILSFLRRNVTASNLSLPDLARALHLSESRTGHLVRELFGESFSYLLREERIRVAKVLLVSTGLTAREISERAGFQTPYYFSQVFRNETGHTPLQYRKKNTPRAG